MFRGGGGGGLCGFIDELLRPLHKAAVGAGSLIPPQLHPTNQIWIFWLQTQLQHFLQNYKGKTCTSMFF